MYQPSSPLGEFVGVVDKRQKRDDYEDLPSKTLTSCNFGCGGCGRLL